MTGKVDTHTRFLAPFQRRRREVLFSCALTLAMAVTADAITIDYSELAGGDFFGDSVVFRDVNEVTITHSRPLFGMPAVAEDWLFFDPVDFNSAALHPESEHETAVQLRMTIAADDTAWIDTITLRAFGDYTIIGAPGALAEARIATRVSYEVTRITGVDPVFELAGEIDMFRLPEGEFKLADGIGVGVRWQGELHIDVGELLAQDGLSGHATEVIVTLRDNLSTEADGGGSALIAKKGFSVAVETALIPEPTALALGLIGTAVVLGFRRRRGRKARYN